jgi:hypothetical protein
MTKNLIRVPLKINVMNNPIGKNLAMTYSPKTYMFIKQHVEDISDYNMTFKWTIQKWLETILQNKNVMNNYYIL